MTDHTLGDAPIEPAYHAMMNELANDIDDILNEGLKGEDRKVGFVLLVFNFGDNSGRCNYISNGCREDIVKLLEEQLSRFKNQGPAT